MKKNLDISYNELRYNEHILPVPWPFVISRFNCTYFNLFIFQKVGGPVPPGPSAWAGPALGVLLQSFSNDDGDGKEDVKKAIGLLRKTTTLHVHHAFL